MQIKFLTIYGLPGEGGGHVEAQYNLLNYWQRSLIKCRVLPVKQASIEFNDYALAEYYNQEKLANEINHKTSYHFDGKQFWQAMGKRYDLFKDLYNDLAKTHRLMELVITVENGDYL
jgi:hypothetical protein